MKDRIAKSVFWIVWSRASLQAISLISTLFIARLLTPSDYGLISLALTFIFPITLISEMGLGTAIVQFRNVSQKELNGCFWLVNGIALLGYLGLYISAPAIARWFETPMLSSILRVNGLVLPFVAIRVIPDNLLRKSLALDKIAKAELIGSALTVPAMLLLAVSGAGVWTLVLGMLVGSLTQTVLTFWFLPWRPGFIVGGERISQVLRFSISTLGSKVCWATYRQADFFVLGKISGDVVLGFYSMAKQLATLPVDKISTVVNQLASPILADLQDKPLAMQVALLRGVRLVACIAFPLCIGMLFVAHDLVRVLLTEKWSECVPALQILCIYAALRSIDVLFPPVLMARFRTKFLFGYSFALLALMPVAFLAGARWNGAIGVAIAWIAVYPVVMFKMTSEALSEVGISWRMLFKQLSSFIAATTSMAFALIALGWSLSHWSNDLAIFRLILMILTAAAVYGVSLFVMDRAIWLEMQEVFGWAIGRKPVLKSTHELAV